MFRPVPEFDLLSTGRQDVGIVQAKTQRSHVWAMTTLADGGQVIQLHFVLVEFYDACVQPIVC